MDRNEVAELVKKAREESQRCRAAYMNCVYNDSRVNDMLLSHATLYDKLAAALEQSR